MVNGIWYKVDEALPPPDKKQMGRTSVEVAIVLKQGYIKRGFRYYMSGPNCWAILGGEKDLQVGDDDIVYWTMIPD